MGRQRVFLREGWLALSALLGAGLALPLAPSAWHGPEVAAILAVAAIALLAGQRWAIAVIVLAELLLVPTAAWRAVLGPGWIPRLISIATIGAIVPGLRALPHAAVALAGMTGQARTERMYRYAHFGLIVIGVVAVLVPLL
ncbi:MAG TPA: hypothetical protein VK607_03150 [Kofleriaceae bacterium]|nr:hypothetical protein [Kofleriaceae bacterium]